MTSMLHLRPSALDGRIRLRQRPGLVHRRHIEYLESAEWRAALEAVQKRFLKEQAPLLGKAEYVVHMGNLNLHRRCRIGVAMGGARFEERKAVRAHPILLRAEPGGEGGVDALRDRRGLLGRGRRRA